MVQLMAQIDADLFLGITRQLLVSGENGLRSSFKPDMMPASCVRQPTISITEDLEKEPVVV